MGKYELEKRFNKLKIQDVEENLDFFTTGGLDICAYIAKKNSGKSNFVKGYRDTRGEYFINSHRMTIGNDGVYKKNAFVAETHADTFLGYAHNLVGIPSCIAYPYFIKQTGAGYYQNHYILPDGVISKDVTEVYPGLEFREDAPANTFVGLYNDDNCIQTISASGRRSKIKETIASICFNNKDAGGVNTYWAKNPLTDKLDYIVSIDHGYSGRDSMFGDPEKVKKDLYFKGEHGYNGMYRYEEDRATTLHYLQRLLSGETIDGVGFSDEEIRDFNSFIDDLKVLDYKEIAKYIYERFGFKIMPTFIDGLELSREDMCKNI